jgi:hypothetical protein
VGSWQEGDRELFRDDRDRWRFLESIGERAGLYGVRLYQYVLMANHFHLKVLGTYYCPIGVGPRAVLMGSHLHLVLNMIVRLSGRFWA